MRCRRSRRNRVPTAKVPSASSQTRNRNWDGPWASLPARRIWCSSSREGPHAWLCESMRYCPTCRSRGYHCVAHQLETIRNYPLHKAALEIECCSCGYAIWRPIFSTRFFLPPVPLCSRAVSDTATRPSPRACERSPSRVGRPPRGAGRGAGGGQRSQRPRPPDRRAQQRSIPYQLPATQYSQQPRPGSPTCENGSVWFQAADATRLTASRSAAVKSDSDLVAHLRSGPIAKSWRSSTLLKCIFCRP
jgi:hypothetical protein